MSAWLLRSSLLPEQAWTRSQPCSSPSCSSRCSVPPRFARGASDCVGSRGDRAGTARAVDYADSHTDYTPSAITVPRFATVVDVMTKGRIFTVHEDTDLDEALEILVNNRITGLPVVNDDEVVVGVVSDFDMLTLDAVSGKARYESSGIFPDTNTDWNTFFQVQKLISKNQGKRVVDVMTHNPMVVRGNTDLEGAARLLLEKHIRRMPVVDSDGRLVGIFSRGDVIRAALAQRKAAALKSMDQSLDGSVDQEEPSKQPGKGSQRPSDATWLRGD